MFSAVLCTLMSLPEQLRLCQKNPYTGIPSGSSKPMASEPHGSFASPETDFSSGRQSARTGFLTAPRQPGSPIKSHRNLEAEAASKISGAGNPAGLFTELSTDAGFLDSGNRPMTCRNVSLSIHSERRPYTFLDAPIERRFTHRIASPNFRLIVTKNGERSNRCRSRIWHACCTLMLRVKLLLNKRKERDSMKRKGLWLAGLALAGLLSFAPDAHAGVWVGFRGGPRHEVIVAHPGWYRVAGYRGWYGEGYGCLLYTSPSPRD